MGSWESRARTWSRSCAGLGSCAVTLSAWPLRRGWASEWPRRRARCRSLAASRILRWWSGSWRTRSAPGGCCGRTTPRRRFSGPGCGSRRAGTSPGCIGFSSADGGPIPLACGRSSSIWRWARSRRPRRRTCSATPGAATAIRTIRSVPTGTSGRSGWTEVGVRLRNGCGGGRSWRRGSQCSSRRASASSVMGRGSRPRRARSRRPSSCASRCRSTGCRWTELSPRESSQDSSAGGRAPRRRQQSSVPGATPRCCATRR